MRQRLEELLALRILVLDGAMGTAIQAHGLSEDDFRGDRFLRHRDGSQKYLLSREVVGAE